MTNALMEESIFSSMVEGATTTRVKAKEMLRKKKKEQKDISKFLKLENINDRQAQIPFWIEKDADRSFTVKEIETVFSVTNQTARTDLEELVNKNLIKKTAVNKKSSSYWKGPGFETIL